MDSYFLTKKQARQFILVKQGLLGNHKFVGKKGIIEFIQQAGCVQYDPIDVCGKNAELVLQARVKGFGKQLLYELLYDERKLVDYFDKNLAIIDVNDWKHFERTREAYKRQVRGREEVEKIELQVKEQIEEKGPLCSKDLGFHEKVDWYWSSTKLSRAALETLYFRGELIVHHKKGTIKYYALAKDYLPSEILQQKDPHSSELDHMKWRVLRRISAVGLLWNKPSDAWLAISNLKANERNEVFQQLLSEAKLLQVQVEGIKEPLYCLKEDKELLELAQQDAMLKLKPRTELIAPLDSMLWDRKLMKALFDFDYKWEIYTPESERKYGYYVLPILSGDSLIGRTEVICDRQERVLKVKNLWLENGIRKSAKLDAELRKCFERFRAFHELCAISYSDKSGLAQMKD